MISWESIRWPLRPKERILDVAERLFADFGFPVTSLRDITREAGVNLAAVNYHFGSKEALARRQVIDLALSGNADEFALKALAERVRDEAVCDP